MFDAFLRICHWTKIYYLWRSNLVDENDNYLVELAVAGNAEISVNKLIEELATIALTEFDAETRFKLRANRGSIERGLELIDQAKKHFYLQNA